MTTAERLRQTIITAESALIPPPIVALIRAIDDQPRPIPVSDLIAGCSLTAPGANLALAIALTADRHGESDPAAFLDRCNTLAMAELLVNYQESGFFRLVDEANGNFAAWIAGKRVPPGWRERADFDWWSAHTADRFDLQLGYPPDAELGGCRVRDYRLLLNALIERTHRQRESGVSTAPDSERALIQELAQTLHWSVEATTNALGGFTVDRETVRYHAAVPGIAFPPLIRTAPDRIICSWQGLTGEPLLFLARELRRRDANAYNNSAVLREDVFRGDLYAQFSDRRFVTSARRIMLRRAAGDARTDIDAAIFDRKSGTLALFELKSQDPFARSPAELQRQRDSVLYANRQIAGALDWIKRHGPDEILHRIDPASAKTFRAQKVYPFVLGRFLAHFNDGAPPDPRAAWGTWPQLLRLLAAQPIRGNESNPIASLFNRLRGDPPNIEIPTTLPARRLDLGDTALTVYPSYAAYRGEA
jgi:hypothetical protein